MPVRLGLSVPAWDDGDIGFSNPAPAANLGSTKAQDSQKQRTDQLKPKSPSKAHGAIIPAGRAEKRVEMCDSAHRPPNNEKKPSKQSDARQIRHDTAALLPVTAGANIEHPIGARKRKRRKGKHSKNADQSVAIKGVADKDASGESKEHTQVQDSTAGSQHGRDESGNRSKRAKKRKRKNRFRESGDAKSDEEGDRDTERETRGTGVSDPKKQKRSQNAQSLGSNGESDPSDKRKTAKPATKAAEQQQAGRSKNASLSPPASAQGQHQKGTQKDAGKQGRDDKFPFKDMGAVAQNRRLTPLQAKLAAKLEAAHFRMLNEELYTTPSSAAVDMFSKDPSLFATYHQGFRRQTLKWPVNPVDVILKFLKKHPKWTIADLGCGDAKIAHSLAEGRVHSFDLVSVNSKVTACDIAHVPLPDDAVDAVVLSLALMGTNYAQFLKEANRIVRTGGRVLIAEVRSRCEHVLQDFIALLNSLGFKVDEGDASLASCVASTRGGGFWRSERELQVDKGNKMFIMFYLTKARKCASGSLSKLAAPELKACQYKKR